MQGFGAALLRQVQASATTRGLPVRLNVLKVNPARALYERLGFVVVREDDARWSMESPIGTGASAGCGHAGEVLEREGTGGCVCR
jgi:hypothetical protein